MSRQQLSSGVELFYTDDGDPSAPVVLFVHGWSCDSHDWSGQLPYFADAYRPVAVDLRGHGRSSVPQSGYGTGVLAEDVAELAERLEITQLVGVGHSMGAMVLSALAIARPELVRGLALVDPAYGAPDEVAEHAKAALPALRGPDGVNLLRGQIEALEAPGTPQPLRTWHVRRLLGMSQTAALAAFEEMLAMPDRGRRARAASYTLPTGAARSCPSTL